MWAVTQLLLECRCRTGALSDRFGADRVILLSNFGLGLDYAPMALALTLSWLFVVGRLISA